jgi:hypothetical protein
MFKFISTILDLVTEYFKARKERAVKRWNDADGKYHEIRAGLSDDALDNVELLPPTKDKG